jgi:hypothetical protein
MSVAIPDGVKWFKKKTSVEPEPSQSLQRLTWAAAGARLRNERRRSRPIVSRLRPVERETAAARNGNWLNVKKER